MTPIRKRLSLTVVFAVLLVLPTVAQNVPAPVQASQKVWESPRPQDWPFSFGPMGLKMVQERVGLSDAQMRQMFQIYEQTKKNLVDLRVEVEKRERDLQWLLDTPVVDLALAERAVDEVLEARNRLSKATTMMMVRMRQVMTQEQWQRMQDLQQEAKNLQNKRKPGAGLGTGQGSGLGTGKGSGPGSGTGSGQGLNRKSKPSSR